MDKLRKVLALMLALAMIFGLAACTSGGSGEQGGTDEPETNETPLVVGYSPFSSKFSPFFSETAYDQDVYAMTQISLLNSDRMGAVVEKGIEGTTIPYNGTDYTYYGPADVEITQNADGTVYYDFTLRDDLTFSDGTPITIDDVIFSYYVLCDPTYDGSSTLFAQPIEGMQEYRSGMDTLFNLLVEAGEDNTDYTFWDEATQTAFWADLNQAGEAFAQEIVDYCVDAGYATNVAEAASAWGFDGLAEDATAADFFALLCEDYGWDLASMSSTESAGSSLFDLMEGYDNYTVGVVTGNSADHISGIQKTGDYSMRVVMSQFDATAIYNLGVSIAPLHYYGDPAQFDYDNNQFGFPKGDLSLVRAKTTEPMGAGPYKFIKFENGVVYFEANESYYLGAPKTKYVNFQECMSDDDKLNGVITGTIDITDPSFSTDVIDAIEQANGGELSGAKIETNTVDNLGYGYIGISADIMNVGGKENKASDASKALRKAFGTIFSVYRDVAVDSYYGDRASVINYPISNTSWAAPRPADDDYQIAFSVDVDGNPLYTSDMT
ncbi:MAG: ABC transporter substrate-binding protein, partial [Firmicutes bacterium]|nr:ABC transporter substrate-binding protein [Bacillota bacterium]